MWMKLTDIVSEAHRDIRAPVQAYSWFYWEGQGTSWAATLVLHKAKMSKNKVCPIENSRLSAPLKIVLGRPPESFL